MERADVKGHDRDIVESNRACCDGIDHPAGGLGSGSETGEESARRDLDLFDGDADGYHGRLLPAQRATGDQGPLAR
jgi:hypothetical protein